MNPHPPEPFILTLAGGFTKNHAKIIQMRTSPTELTFDFQLDNERAVMKFSPGIGSEKA
ncbi:MAG: hypothetical protein O9353_12270 [Bacteroidia bacterium]|nr:hypothetical protein [Bacteroidia bacterium]